MCAHTCTRCGCRQACPRPMSLKMHFSSLVCNETRCLSQHVTQCPAPSKNIALKKCTSQTRRQLHRGWFTLWSRFLILSRVKNESAAPCAGLSGEKVRDLWEAPVGWLCWEPHWKCSPLKNTEKTRTSGKERYRGLQDGDGGRRSEHARLGGHEAEHKEQNRKRSGKPSRTPRRLSTT